MPVSSGIQFVDTVNRVTEPPLIPDGSITWNHVHSQGRLIFELGFSGMPGRMSGLIPYILVRSGSLVLAHVDMREPMHFSTSSGKQMVSLESLMAHPTACTGYFAKCCIAHLVASRCRLAISYEGVAGEQAASRLVFFLESGYDGYQAAASIRFDEVPVNIWFRQQEECVEVGAA